MAALFPIHKVIQEVLTEAFEHHIRKSIGDLPLSFEKCQENGYTPYIIKNTNENLFALLYFSYDNLRFELHLKRFLEVVKKLRQEDEVHFSACAIGIGLSELGTVKELMKTGTDFYMVNYQHFIKTFDGYGIRLNKDLTMDIDGSIHYQSLPEDKKHELIEVLLGEIQNCIDHVIKRCVTLESAIHTTASNTESL